MRLTGPFHLWVPSLEWGRDMVLFTEQTEDEGPGKGSQEMTSLAGDCVGSLHHSWSWKGTIPWKKGAIVFWEGLWASGLEKSHITWMSLLRKLTYLCLKILLCEARSSPLPRTVGQLVFGKCLAFLLLVIACLSPKVIQLFKLVL